MTSRLVTGRQLAVFRACERARGERYGRLCASVSLTIDRRRRKNVGPDPCADGHRSAERGAASTSIGRRSTRAPPMNRTRSRDAQTSPIAIRRAQLRRARSYAATLSQRRDVEHLRAGRRESAVERAVPAGRSRTDSATPAALMLNARVVRVAVGRAVKRRRPSTSGLSAAPRERQQIVHAALVALLVERREGPNRALIAGVQPRTRLRRAGVPSSTADELGAIGLVSSHRRVGVADQSSRCRRAQLVFGRRAGSDRTLRSTYCRRSTLVRIALVLERADLLVRASLSAVRLYVLFSMRRVFAPSSVLTFEQSAPQHGRAPCRPRRIGRSRRSIRASARDRRARHGSGPTSGPR